MNKLLVVDDEPFSVAGVVEGIDWNSIGVSSVFGVTSVGEARNMVRKQEIDVIICDIEMAGENGLDFLKWLRGNGYSSKLIFLTAYPRFEYAQEAIGWGISDYLIKPVDFQVLKDRVRVVLEQYREEKNDAEKVKEYERMRQEQMPSEPVVMETDCASPAEETPNVSAVIQRVKEYIERNLCSDITRESIANEVYVNPSYLSRLFHKETGEKLSDYILRMRMQAAKDMLENTDAKVTFIAQKVGYCNDSYFIRVFKAVTGMTPYEYRKLCRA